LCAQNSKTTQWQEYLFRRAEKHCVPAVDNTNVDRSVAAIHATIVGCMRRRALVSSFLASSQGQAQG